jgi:hypothetical protein
MTETGSRNCLLYCEMVDNHPPPGAPIVTWAGNFATKKSTQPPMDQIDGSFLLGRAVFFEPIILKHLSQLNQATSIFHGKMSPAFHENGKKELTYNLPVTYGGHPEHPNRDDTYYALETNNPMYKPEITTKYTWSKTQTVPNETEWNGITVNTESGHSNCKQWASGELWLCCCFFSLTQSTDTMHSDVTWVPGTPEIKVSGRTLMVDDVIYDQGIQPPNFTDNNLTSWARYVFCIMLTVC